MSGMQVWVRAASIPVTLLTASVLVFTATESLPGDVARTVLGREASDESVRQLHQSMGLDQPLATRYLHWLYGFVRGDWGTSYTLHVPVRELLLERLGNSLLLAAFTLLLLIPVALLLGLTAGLHHDRPLDRLISTVTLALGAIPEFVTGVILLVVFAVQLRWLPASAQADTGAGLLIRLQHLALPAVSLVALCTGYIARHVRASTVSAVESPYAQAASVRGASQWQVVRRHVLRNASVPAMSAIGVQAQFLLGGLVAVEMLFTYPGVGALLLQAAISKDLPTLQATAVVLGLLYIVIMQVVDIAYRLLDPRLRSPAAS
ncbi:ABC transporter permease [Streptomyces sp. NPDC093228]|uniref:ABC transporter permease n=1 Tax=Streptomyces sp. NPDC093228 TaxID=3155070 RepID=UPI0034359C71